MITLPEKEEVHEGNAEKEIQDAIKIEVPDTHDIHDNAESPYVSHHLKPSKSKHRPPKK